MTMEELEYPRTHNEFRSDTFTVPSKEMLNLALSSSLGDAVYNEDEDTNELERKVASLAGKEAGLYCVSGTLSNQIALKSHLLEPPCSIICDYRAHIMTAEAAGIATLCQAMPIGVIPKNGKYLVLEDILDRLVPDEGNIHFAPTRLIALENTIAGVRIPLYEIERISQFCKENNIILHCDGARLWNAAVSEGVALSEISKYFDSVSLCLSKTLGAPVGSVLVGSQRFIAKANHFRKQNGGGIRQSGFIARMAMYAIDNNFSKLARTHAMAKEFEEFLLGKDIPVMYPVDTNFVFVDLAKAGIPLDILKKHALENKVNVRGARFAFHYQVSDESLQQLKKTVYNAYQEAKSIEDDPKVSSTKKAKIY